MRVVITKSVQAARPAAAQSSAMMPRPSGKFSSCRQGGGFVMSNKRKSRKPISMTSHVRCWEGTTRSTSGIAANSSRMMDDESFCPPSCREAIVQIGIPIQHTASQNAHSMKRGNWAKENAVIIGSAATDPQVPGAGRSLPIQKQVASTTAGCQSVCYSQGGSC